MRKYIFQLLFFEQGFLIYYQEFLYQISSSIRILIQAFVIFLSCET